VPYEHVDEQSVGDGELPGEESPLARAQKADEFSGGKGGEESFPPFLWREKG